MSAILVSTVGALWVPVTMRETHVSSMGIAENPVETGATISDHAYMKPRRLTLEIAQAYPLISWQMLRHMQREAATIAVVTGLDVYTDMMIEELTADRASNTGVILAGSIVMKQVVMVTTATVETNTASTEGGAEATTSETSADDASTQARTADTSYRGDTPTTDAPTEGTGAAASKNQSILSSIVT